MIFKLRPHAPIEARLPLPLVVEVRVEKRLEFEFENLPLLVATESLLVVVAAGESSDKVLESNLKFSPESLEAQQLEFPQLEVQQLEFPQLGVRQLEVQQLVQQLELPEAEWLLDVLAEDYDFARK
jgi:hypothetical protein